MPLLKQARFAAVCKVNRASINQLVAKGTLIADADGRIDTDNPVNQSYILKHNPSGLMALNAPPPPPPSDPPAPAKRGRPRKPEHQPTPRRKDSSDETERPAAKDKPGRQGIGDILASIMGIDKLQSEEGEGNPAFSPAEMIEVLRKNLYEAQKIKADAQLKQANLDKMHGTLGEREVFESFVLELWQALQRNYIDVAPKQASLICKRLGMVGHETEVMDVLEGDISKRMDNVAHEIQAILAGRMTQKADIEEDEEEPEPATGGKKSAEGRRKK